MSGDSKTLPSRQATQSSTFSDEAIPETDPNSTAGLLAERLQAWKHAVGYVEEYIGAVEKVHKEQAKEYEKVLKTISKPLREGHHFTQEGQGVARFFETMRVNTEGLINTNIETEKQIKDVVLKGLQRLHMEIKAKAKELAHGAQKSAKEIEKARNTTQKHIELLGQQTASFESAGGKIASHDDPYVVHRGVLHRLNKQVLEENNHRNDLIGIQKNFETFEAHIIQTMQHSMEEFDRCVSGQAENTRNLYGNTLGALQAIKPDYEWSNFAREKSNILINPNEGPRTVESISFPNMTHPSTKPLIEGSLERKSRNKLSWGYSTGYYVVTPSKFLHEFKDSDNMRNDPKPELSIYLPDAVIGAPNMEKFNVKGKDRSKSVSSKLVGSSEISFKAHTAADADTWFSVIKEVAGATGPAAAESAPVSPISPTEANALKSVEERTAADHKAQEAGITGEDAVTSPTALSPTTTEKTSLPGSAAVSRSNTVSSPTAAATTTTTTAAGPAAAEGTKPAPVA